MVEPYFAVLRHRQNESFLHMYVNVCLSLSLMSVNSINVIIWELYLVGLNVRYFLFCPLEIRIRAKKSSSQFQCGCGDEVWYNVPLLRLSD